MDETTRIRMEQDMEYEQLVNDFLAKEQRIVEEKNEKINEFIRIDNLILHLQQTKEQLTTQTGTRVKLISPNGKHTIVIVQSSTIFAHLRSLAHLILLEQWKETNPTDPFTAPKREFVEIAISSPKQIIILEQDYYTIEFMGIYNSIVLRIAYLDNLI